MGPVSQKILSPLVILSMEKTMVAKVISELKSISRLKIFRETGPWCYNKGGATYDPQNLYSGKNFLTYCLLEARVVLQ